MRICIRAALLAALFSCVAGLSLAASSSGLVITVQPGAWVERGGEKIDLAMKSEVRVGDVLLTDATGRIQVIFADDTTISLGADTRVAVADFIFDEPGKDASFSADMARGAARFVTGKVVEQNREGFSVSTPQATVGIRGTTFAVDVKPDGVTSVIGLNVDGAFPIAVTNMETGAVSTITVSGMAVDASTSGNTSYQTPPGQFSQTGSSVSAQPRVAAASGGDGSGAARADAGTSAVSSSGTLVLQAEAEAAPGGAADDAPAASPASSGAGISTVASAGAGAGVSPGVPGGSLYVSEPSAARDLANSQGRNPLDILEDIGQPPSLTPDHSAASGTYTGLLYAPLNPVYAGSFSFQATLSPGTGTITNTHIIVNNDWPNGLTASQVGGGVTVTGGQFYIPLAVDAPGTGGGSPQAGDYGYMDGGFGPGSTVSGSWSVKQGTTPGASDMYTAGPGTFEGAKQ